MNVRWRRGTRTLECWRIAESTTCLACLRVVAQYNIARFLFVHASQQFERLSPGG